MLHRMLLVGMVTSFGAPVFAQEFDASPIDKRVADWQPTRAERRFDDIGWAPDLCTALKAGKVHQRPVFLFTHDGRMQFGRC
jgi:hypothetical protein